VPHRSSRSVDVLRHAAVCAHPFRNAAKRSLTRRQRWRARQRQFPRLTEQILVARTQIRRVLERKVGELPEIFRVVFVLRSVEELSVEEIADIVAISPETVRSRHFRARGILRESLAKDIDLAEADVYEFGGAHCVASSPTFSSAWSAPTHHHSGAVPRFASTVHIKRCVAVSPVASNPAPPA